jgi:hypothetical protein
MTFSPIDLYSLANLHHTNPDEAMRVAADSARSINPAALREANKLTEPLRGKSLEEMARDEMERIENHG